MRNWSAALLASALLLCPARSGFGQGDELARAQAQLGLSRSHSAGVFVGINRFYGADGKPSEEWNALRFAVDDAVDLAHLFVNELQLIDAKNVRLLLEGEPKAEDARTALAALVAAGAVRARPTKELILSVLRRARQESGESGLLVVSFASHGITERGSDYLLAPQVGDPEAASVPLATVLDEVSQARAPRRIVLIDACRDRASLARGGELPMAASFQRAMRNAKGMAVLSSTVIDGLSFEDRDRQNGVFTASLIDGLRGAAPGNRDGLITVSTLASYLDRTVRGWVRENRARYAQRSTGITMNVEDFRSAGLPLAVNPDGVERAAAYRADVTDVATILREAIDFETLDGHVAQQVYEALQVADPDAGGELVRRVRELRGADAAARDAFVAWWVERGAREYAPEAGRPGGDARGRTAAPARWQTVDADREPNDEMGEASALSPTTTVSGQVSSADDPRDWYAIVPPDDGVLVVDLRNLEPSASKGGELGVVEVLNAEQTSLHRFRELRGGREEQAPPVPLSAGRPHYIRVDASRRQARAKYSLTTRFSALAVKDSFEPNDTVGDALALSVGESRKGRVGFGDDARDWYRITPPHDGVLTVSVTNLHRTEAAADGVDVEVFDPKMSALGRIPRTHLRSGRTQSAAPILVASGRAVFVVVSSVSKTAAAPYSVDAAFERLTVTDAREDNGSRSSAAPIRPNAPVEALVGFGDDAEDWYRYDAARDGTVTLRIRNAATPAAIENGALGDVEVFEAAGERPMARIHGNRLRPTRSQTVELSVRLGGSYYIRVRPAKPHHAAPYVLDVSAE